MLGKGEVACYELFSFSRSVFKRLVLQTHKNQGLFGEQLTLYSTITTFKNPDLKKKNLRKY